MKLNTLVEPSATITLSITELKAMSAAHGWALEYWGNQPDSIHTNAKIQEHDSLKVCIDSVIHALQ